MMGVAASAAAVAREAVSATAVASLAALTSGEAMGERCGGSEHRA